MGYSPLACKQILANSTNYTKGRQKPIRCITIHHMAGNLSIEQCGALWQNPSRNGSSHYGIGTDGRIANYVDEVNTAWTNSNWNSNCESITIETANDQIGGNWHVSDQALNSLIRLVADISKRNGLGKLVKGQNLTWHSMFSATTCPGDYLRSRLDYIVQEANKINETARIKYRSHIGEVGWQGWKKDGELSGTTGEGKRLEAIQIDFPKEVYAKAHIEDKGWVDYGKITKDTVIGTTGQSKRLECLCLKGDFKYRVHIQNNGWTCWTNADGVCTLGSVGQKLRIEAIEVK